MAVNDTALIAVVGASIAIYVGLTGKSFSAAIKGIIKGQSPASQPQTNAIAGIAATSGTTTVGTGGSATGQNIARDALSYQGHAYLYGGAPGPSGANPWDCSSFCNWVLGHDFGLTIPLGTKNYNGASHGPNTIAYLAWTGAKTISYANAEAGDLAVWQTHMGIFISPTEMISAQNPADGTRVSNVKGFIPGEILVVRRLAGLVSAPGANVYPTPTTQSNSPYTNLG